MKKTEIKILRNSLYLSSQTVLLNVLSIFAIGYIARKLGPSDFGIFNFVIIFTTLFLSLGRIGLDNVAIRDLASLRNHRDKARAYVGKILSLRIVLAIVTIAVICLVANIVGYSDRMLHAAYAGTAIVLFQLLGESLTDVFRSYEKMELVALSQLAGGFILTILSVVVLYWGFGLFELIGVYAFGHILIAATALYILQKYFFEMRLEIDISFCKSALYNGIPFFMTSAMWMMVERMDTIFLSKVISVEDLGIYTTAIMLVTKVSIIPQNIGASFYPAISALYSTKKNDEMIEVIRNYFLYILIIALPITILMSYYSKEIIVLIFGSQYARSGSIFRFVIWVIFIRFFGSISFNILATLGKQQLIVKVYSAATILCVLLNVALTLRYNITGAVFSLVSTQCIIVFLLIWFVSRGIPHLFNYSTVAKIVLLNLLMFIVLALFNHSFSFSNDYLNAIITSSLATILYVGSLVLFRILNLTDLPILKRIFI